MRPTFGGESLTVESHLLDVDEDLYGARAEVRFLARIRDERLSLRLTSSLNHAVVYTPRERDYFCVEPVSHVNNALASDEPKLRGMLALGSGETARAWMQLDVAHA